MFSVARTWYPVWPGRDVEGHPSTGATGYSYPALLDGTSISLSLTLRDPIKTLRGLPNTSIGRANGPGIPIVPVEVIWGSIKPWSSTVDELSHVLGLG